MSAPQFTPEETVAHLMPHELDLLTNAGGQYTLVQRDAARAFFRERGITDEVGLYTAYGKRVRAIAKARAE